VAVTDIENNAAYYELELITAVKVLLCRLLKSYKEPFTSATLTTLVLAKMPLTTMA
jgi:hypothetical protein